AECGAYHSWDLLLDESGILRWRGTGDESSAQDLEVESTRVINDGIFHHVAVTRTATVRVELYIDGVLDGTGGSEQGGFFANAAEFVLGKGCDPFYQPFTGLLDEVTMYNRPLLAAEILAIYDAGSPGKCLPPTFCTPPPSGLVNWWCGAGDAS